MEENNIVLGNFARQGAYEEATIALWGDALIQFMRERGCKDLTCDKMATGGFVIGGTTRDGVPLSLTIARTE